MSEERPTGLDRMVFRAAWRLKRLARPFVPAALRQSIARTLFRRAYASTSAPDVSSAPVRPHGRRGLNVLGYLRAESGVAEAARATLRACRAAGVPAAAIDYARPGPSRLAEAAPTGFASTPDFDVTLLHLNADQSAFAVVDHPEALDGKYRIAYWNWELPEFPSHWPEAAQALDEVWAPSTFCASAFSRRLRLPVTCIPYAIDVPVPTGVNREAFGLPPHAFLFLFIFDAFSVPARKNPQAIVEAFRRLRQQTAQPVHLALKVINIESAPDLARDLRQAAASDAAITIVDRYLDRPALNALLQAADAYVSLHRSEGYGFTMAEAMALGKPVVATGWSGNMDFMTPSNACLVDHRLVTLDRDYGPYQRGQQWAEPDVAHAAAQMARLVDDRAFAAAMGARAAADIRERLSPLAVGRLIAARLDALRA